MADARYFNGDSILHGMFGLDNKKFEAQFGTAKARRFDSFARWVGTDAEGVLRPVERVIFFKRNPSRHACGPRCLNAKGHDCECQCGGANHGRGG